jgi:hypothetical protein
MSVLNYALRYEDARRSRSIGLQVFISAVNGGEWSASISGLFAPRGNILGYYLYRRLYRNQGLSGLRKEAKTLLFLTGNERRFLSISALR